MKTWGQVILVNLALTVVGFRVWLDPWFSLGDVSLPDLVLATDPLGPLYSKGSRSSPAPSAR